VERARHCIPASNGAVELRGGRLCLPGVGFRSEAKGDAMSYKMADYVTAGVIMCLGLIVVIDSLRLGSGWGMEGPRPGFFPFLMGAIIIFGCVVVIRQAMQGKGSAKKKGAFVPKEAVKPILTVLIPACLMILFTEVVGLYIAAIVYLTLYIRLVGDFKWLTSLAIGVLVPMAFYVIFEKIFLIPMPAGMYGSTLLNF
jgi:hypothetical protein